MYRMKNGKDVSNETVEMALDAHFEANPELKPKFEPIDVCHVNIDIGGDNLVIIKVARNSGVCRQLPREARKTAAAIIKAADFSEANKK